jgi:hypothetical protein
MSDTETKLVAAALVIALVALLTALGQLLQQYFATADGYRRCQKSVMGEYATKTRLHWRWRQFRFETLYSIPEIFLSGDGAPSRKSQVLLTGSEESRHRSLIPVTSAGNVDEVVWPSWGPPGVPLASPAEMVLAQQGLLVQKSTGDPRGEMASWVEFLNRVHMTTEDSLSFQQKSEDPLFFTPPGVRLPAVVFRKRSWDFQPPDVIRPLSKTTLSDIAVIVRRMGMKWKDFRPSDGILRAEGHSHTITSTVVRSLGIVIHYSYTGQGQRLKMADLHLGSEVAAGSVMNEKEEMYIPSGRADRLGCGVIRGERLLHLPDLTVSTQSEIVTALSHLDRSGASASLISILNANPEFCFRVADLVALTTTEIRHVGSDSNLVQIPAPSDNVCGVTTSSIGRQAFRKCLEEYVDERKSEVGDKTKSALKICHDIGKKFKEWEQTGDLASEANQWVVTRDVKYLNAVNDNIPALTTALCNMEKAEAGFQYHNLIGAHIKRAMFCAGGETSTPRNRGTDYEADMKGYFRSLPLIVEEMRETGCHNSKLIIDAWVTMMLRAMCWGACYFFVPGERVPIQYFGSQLPIYIG